jgi:hypothetical protein
MNEIRKTERKIPNNTRLLYLDIIWWVTGEGERLGGSLLGEELGKVIENKNNYDKLEKVIHTSDGTWEHVYEAWI